MKAQEQAKYEKIWSFSDYRKVSPGEILVENAISEMCMPEGASLVDFGCGTGRAAQYFKDLGFYVIGVDFASNCLDPDVDIIFRQKCIWEPMGLKSDYGFCTDVMEHIPPEYVDQTLSQISNTVRHHCYFQIACRKDGYGRLIGEPLHLTVRTAKWWENTLSEHFTSVRVCKADNSKIIAVATNGTSSHN